MYFDNHVMFYQMEIENIEAYGPILEMKCDHGKSGNYEERIKPLEVIMGRKIAVWNCSLLDAKSIEYVTKIIIFKSCSLSSLECSCAVFQKELLSVKDETSFLF